MAEELAEKVPSVHSLTLGARADTEMTPVIAAVNRSTPSRQNRRAGDPARRHPKASATSSFVKRYGDKNPAFLLIKISQTGL